MKLYGPMMFRNLAEEEIDEFVARADLDFEAAGEELEVKAIWHPVYRIQLARRIEQDATYQLEAMMRRDEQEEAVA